MVLVQLDDRVVDDLDVLVRELELSRSELLRHGPRAVLDAVALTKADCQLAHSYQSLPHDEVIVKVAAQLTRESMPRW